MAKVKSLQQQLQEAINAGNLEAAKIIVQGMEALEKLEKAKSKPKKAVKKKAVTKKPKVKAVKKAEKPIEEDEVEEVKPKKKKLIIPTEAEIIDLTGDSDDDDDDDDGDNDNSDPLIRQGRRRRGEDKGAACRTESINCKNRKIEFFNGNKKEGDAAADSPKNNPVIAKLYAPADAARPHREARKIVKAKVKCIICGKIEVISLDVAPRKGESYKCNSCVTSQGE